MDSLALVILLAVVVEQIVQIFKDILNLVPPLPNKCKPVVLQLISLGVGILLVYNTDVSVFDILGVQVASPQVGLIVSGLVIGKGSNFVHDFFHLVAVKKKAT